MRRLTSNPQPAAAGGRIRDDRMPDRERWPARAPAAGSSERGLMDIRVLDGGVLRRPWVPVSVDIDTGLVLSAERLPSVGQPVATAKVGPAVDDPGLPPVGENRRRGIQSWSSGPHVGRVPHSRKGRLRTA